MEPVIEGPQLECRYPDGRITEVRIRLSLPTADDSAASVFLCQLELVGLGKGPYRIFGNDPLQALCLAIQQAFRLLKAEVEGSHGLVCYPNGSAFPFEAYLP